MPHFGQRDSWQCQLKVSGEVTLDCAVGGLVQLSHDLLQLRVRARAVDDLASGALWRISILPSTRLLFILLLPGFVLHRHSLQSLEAS
jgi:hypothetical protein